jgi:hypothetical protein
MGEKRDVDQAGRFLGGVLMIVALGMYHFRAKFMRREGFSVRGQISAPILLLYLPP